MVEELELKHWTNPMENVLLGKGSIVLGYSLGTVFMAGCWSADICVLLPRSWGVPCWDAVTVRSMGLAALWMLACSCRIALLVGLSLSCACFSSYGVVKHDYPCITDGELGNGNIR